MKQDNGKHTETEIKLWVPDLGDVERRLQDAGAKLKAPRVYEMNARYDDAQGALTAADKVLRLRQDTRVRLTYKEPRPKSEGELTRTELEVEVSDFETMELLLGKLGYQRAWVYEKYRTTYELDGCEIVLDEMPVGMFVEIEGEEETIKRVMARVGLSDAPRMPSSYSILFDQVKSRLNLDVRDLTFENFKDIHVSPEILKPERR